ncbi:uncharacterized protein RSE6_09254 [Rhynchosporium secalis]|uniref:Uncharacterized protein n=1 Tax=Rhynchosporium secalis TaxID=38038 RepID=A0A1E1MHJ9_RHYSE|nr:uncharacterized protein RSE6_09254 [Rhynchosporium secalis]
MLFKSLRSRSKSSSKSTKPSTLTRMLSSASSHHPAQIPEVVISSPSLSPNSVTDVFKTKTQLRHAVTERKSSEDGSKDYNEFLAKARKEAEKEKKEEEKKAKKAREVNMSPWASRMNC